MAALRLYWESAGTRYMEWISQAQVIESVCRDKVTEKVCKETVIERVFKDTVTEIENWPPTDKHIAHTSMGRIENIP